MSHLEDKNSTVAVVLLLRNTLRSQQVTVRQGTKGVEVIDSGLKCVYTYVLTVHTTILYVGL